MANSMSRPTISGGRGAHRWTIHERQLLHLVFTELVLTQDQLTRLVHACFPHFATSGYNAVFKHFRDVWAGRLNESHSAAWRIVARPYLAIGFKYRLPNHALYTQVELAQFAAIRAQVHTTAAANNIPVIFKTDSASQGLGGPQLGGPNQPPMQPNQQNAVQATLPALPALPAVPSLTAPSTLHAPIHVGAAALPAAVAVATPLFTATVSSTRPKRKATAFHKLPRKKTKSSAHDSGDFGDDGESDENEQSQEQGADEGNPNEEPNESDEVKTNGKMEIEAGGSSGKNESHHPDGGVVDETEPSSQHDEPPGDIGAQREEPQVGVQDDDNLASGVFDLPGSHSNDTITRVDLSTNYSYASELLDQLLDQPHATHSHEIQHTTITQLQALARPEVTHLARYRNALPAYHPIRNVRSGFHNSNYGEWRPAPAQPTSVSNQELIKEVDWSWIEEEFFLSE